MGLWRLRGGQEHGAWRWQWRSEKVSAANVCYYSRTWQLQLQLHHTSEGNCADKPAIVPRCPARQQKINMTWFHHKQECGAVPAASRRSQVCFYIRTLSWTFQARTCQRGAAELCRTLARLQVISGLEAADANQLEHAWLDFWRLQKTFCIPVKYETKTTADKEKDAQKCAIKNKKALKPHKRLHSCLKSLKLPSKN